MPPVMDLETLDHFQDLLKNLNQLKFASKSTNFRKTQLL